MEVIACKSLTLLLTLAVCISLVAGEGEKRQRCGKGCYKVLEMNGKFKECDCCEKNGGLTTPCAVTMCSPGAQCVVEKRPCELGDKTIGCDHDLRATCRAPCKDELCKEGYTEVYQASGCKKCEDYRGQNFTNPCFYTECGYGQSCTLLQVQCFVPPCYPIAQCKPQPVKCPTGCIKYVTSGGGEGCECCNGCVGKICPNDAKCTLGVVNCIRAPCPPKPSC